MEMDWLKRRDTGIDICSLLNLMSETGISSKLDFLSFRELMMLMTSCGYTVGTNMDAGKSPRKKSKGLTVDGGIFRSSSGAMLV